METNNAKNVLELGSWQGRDRTFFAMLDELHFIFSEIEFFSLTRFSERGFFVNVENLYICKKPFLYQIFYSHAFVFQSYSARALYSHKQLFRPSNKTASYFNLTNNNDYKV